MKNDVMKHEPWYNRCCFSGGKSFNHFTIFGVLKYESGSPFSMNFIDLQFRCNQLKVFIILIVMLLYESKWSMCNMSLYSFASLSIASFTAGSGLEETMNKYLIFFPWTTLSLNHVSLKTFLSCGFLTVDIIMTTIKVSLEQKLLGWAKYV